MDETEQAIVDWVHTFDLPNGVGCTSMTELCDGFIISTILQMM